MTPNTIDSNGNKWIRCTECGDSKNKHHAHMLVDTKGSCYCFRCGYSSQLDINSLIDIAIGNCSIDEALEKAQELKEREIQEDVINRRFTLLPIFQVEDCPEANAFEMRNQNGDRIGFNLRYPNKKFINEGERGIGYINNVLISSPDKPIVVVEGSWDVIEPHFVCTFGSISAGILKKFFRLQFCYLWPDPDILENELKRIRFVEKVIKPALDSFVFIQGIIISEEDPDIAKIRKYITIQDVLKDTNWKL